MKKILITLCALSVCTFAHAQTETMNWYVEGALYDTTTCESGGDIDLPAITPTKRGYTFQGWWTYTPIEYLESTGTQTISTGFVPNNSDFRGIAKFSINDFPTNKTDAAKNVVIFSVFSNGIDYNAVGFMVNWISNDTYASRTLYGPGGSAASAPGIVQYPFTVNTIYEVETVYSQTKITTNINGHTVSDFSKTMGSDYQTNSLGLFGTSGNAAKIYYVQFYENNTLVRDFVPVLDYNGVPCMFDKVTETFFYNQGTGDFIAGPIVAED